MQPFHRHFNKQHIIKVVADFWYVTRVDKNLSNLTKIMIIYIELQNWYDENYLNYCFILYSNVQISPKILNFNLNHKKSLN